MRVHVVTRPHLPVSVAVVACGFLLAGCGGEPAGGVTAGGATPAPPPTGGQPSSKPAEEVPATSSSTAQSSAPDGGAASAGSLQDVEAATIQIVAEGTFVDPEMGEQANWAGSGSGFIVDPEGIAVTNNHVVTGAAFLEVYVGGSDKPTNARVLGVSECSDLAVIDLDGAGYPSLAWAAGEPAVGQDAYAAGFPLGDPEYTLTRGIVSKAEADGESSWASVDHVLEHDATINPGNSGGPLVDGSGNVLGVNYAGNPETRQQYAIVSTEAREIVEQLREGADVDSLGINGQATVGDDGASGIWVASVESGSPADDAGVEGGDVITRLENMAIATDGTMREYCDILRSRNATDVLRLEVFRVATGEVLEGQVNGDPLQVVTSFEEELAEGEGVEDGSDYADYVSITDDTGAVSVDVPVEWGDVNGAPYTGSDGIDRVDVRASSDLDAFGSGWDTPGMIFTASSGLARTTAVDDLLDVLGEGVSGSCTYGGRESYEDTLYSGSYDVYVDCGSSQAVYVIVAVQPEDASFLASVQVQANSDADLAALDRILSSFVVTGEV